MARRVLALALVLTGCTAREPDLVVLAASSLTEVLTEIGEGWEAKTGQHVALSFDGTSRLAAQLRGGRKADLFLAADVAWMEAMRQEGRVQQPHPLLGNELVVVVPEASKGSAPSSLSDLSRVALAGEHVPAGRYARQALAAEGVDVGEIVSGPSVRHVLAWVARGEAPAGVVYRTDARIEPRVHVAWAFPAASHEPIVYPVALTTHARPEAAAFLDHLRAQAPVFEAADFKVLR